MRSRALSTSPPIARNPDIAFECEDIEATAQRLEAVSP